MRKKIIKKEKEKEDKKVSKSPLYWEDDKYEDDLPSQDVVYKVHHKKRPFNSE